MQILFMSLFSLSLAYIILGIYIFHKNKQSTINTIFFIACLATSLWSIGFALMYIAPNKHIANIWRIVSAIGWCSFYSIWLDFSISISRKKEIIKPKRLLIYIPALLFFMQYSSYSPGQVMIRLYNGWNDTYPVSIITILFSIYCLITPTIDLVLIYKWGKHSNLIREKKQSQVLVITSTIAFIIGALIDIIMPLFKITIFPYSAVLSISIAMFGAWYAISKYKMMIIAPEYMSDYIFKSVNNPIFIIDENFKIKNANTSSLKAIGYTLLEIKQQSINNIISQCDSILTMLIDKKAVNKIEVNLISKSGNSLDCLLSGNILYDKFNDILGIVIILQDISDRKRYEAILQNYNLELENRIVERTIELEKANDAKSEFFANISHELRTPINVIHSAVQLFSLYIKDDSIYNKDNAAKHLKSMNQNCQRLIRLVNNIIDTTKIEANHFNLTLQNCDIVFIAKRITESIEVYVQQKGISLSFYSNVDKMVIACDINVIERVLLNLLSNAIKFTNPNGHISVSILSDTECVKISVKDDGIGIPQNLHSVIFERFKQGDNLLTREHEGSGIGLAITKDLVEMHKGSVSVISENGSEFIVKLPCTLVDEAIEHTELMRNGQNLTENIDIEFSDIYY